MTTDNVFQLRVAGSKLGPAYVSKRKTVQVLHQVETVLMLMVVVWYVVTPLILVALLIGFRERTAVTMCFVLSVFPVVNAVAILVNVRKTRVLREATKIGRRIEAGE